MLPASRRAVLSGLGSALVAAFAPAPVRVALPRSLRSLEDILGPERLARAHYLWNLPNWLWSGGDTMLDAEGRFAMSPVFRTALTAIMNGCEAVEFTHGERFEGFLQYHRNKTGLAVLSQFSLLPPQLGFDHFWESRGDAWRDAFTVGDSWKRMGWPPPRRYVQQEFEPASEWMMTGVARQDTPFLLKHVTLDMGWGEPDFGDRYPKRPPRLDLDRRPRNAA